MPHLAGEIFSSLAGVKLVHVPYKGSRASRCRTCSAASTSSPSTRCRRRRRTCARQARALLGTSSAARQPAFPDVPTAQKAGLAGYQVIDLVRRVRARRYAARDRQPPARRPRQSDANARTCKRQARRHRRRRHGVRARPRSSPRWCAPIPRATRRSSRTSGLRWIDDMQLSPYRAGARREDQASDLSQAAGRTARWTPS